MYDGQGSRYSSLLSAVRTIAREEGLRGFCSGMVPGSIAATISWGGYFYFYEGCKSRHLNNVRSREGPTAELSHAEVLLSGIEAGSIMTFITNPLWLIKTRLQLQGAAVSVPTSSRTNINRAGGAIVSTTVATNAAAMQHRYTGVLDAVVSIVSEEGVRGLYRGLLPALFLTTHGAVQFVSYEFLKKEVQVLGWATPRPNSNQSTSISPLGGGGQLDIPMYLTAALGFLSKLVATTVTYPYQVMKARLQQREILVADEASSVFRAQAKYRGMLDCVKQIVKYEGLVGFYKGYLANCIKVAPSAAITFAVYEQALKVISMHFE